MKNYISLTFALIAMLLLSTSYASFVGSAYIYAPAVLTQSNKGILSLFYLNVTTGNGVVTISGPSSVGESTLNSAQTGVEYACKYLGLNMSDYNFSYIIEDKNVSVSGPSGGLAFTLDAISALSHKPLLHDFTLTGTISPDGSVGEIGGVYDKVAAAKMHNLKFVLVPYVENGSFENLLYYVAQQTFGIPLVEVKNASQAFAYATGLMAPHPLTYNIYTNYHVDKIPYANLSCLYCNLSSFQNLTSFTFGFINKSIADIPNNYSTIKSELTNAMQEYAAISKKGYLYTAADLAFLIYPQAFMLANANNANKTAAANLISNVSTFCSSLVPSQMTNSNYEYVIGGELRQELGTITAGNAATILNSSETSDGIFESLYTAGEAYGWCLAASEMYSIANSIGGVPVQSSPLLKSYASKLIQNASEFGGSIYLQSAINFYNNGDYPAAIYAGIYASILDKPTINNYTSSEYVSIEKGLINNATYGIWPNQFAKSVIFYINEYNITGNESNLESAYSLALLASKLSSANKLINSTFILQPNQTYSYNNISSEIEQIYSMLIMILIVLFAILIVLILLLLRNPCNAQSEKLKEGASNKQIMHVKGRKR
ncbi:MAG: S16 family serine protease [Candidatus Micrarchaeota archaeon]